MSFCRNNSSGNFPGTIIGNPLNGLCEKVCIQVNRVFDACLSQMLQENVLVNATNFTPPAPIQPLTFISARSTTNRGNIVALTITPLSDRPRFSRVQVTIEIPIEILYTDVNGVEGRATATYTVSLDVIMCVPQNSVIPVTIGATVALVSTIGNHVGDTVFNLTSCITIVLKAEAEVELLVPTYGYCRIPPCQEFTQDICQGVFEMPLFPTSAAAAAANTNNSNNNNNNNNNS